MVLFDYSAYSYNGPIEFPVAVSRFDNGAEVRGLIISENDDTITLKSPNLTETDMQAYIAFYNARNGAYEAFTWVSDFDGSTYNVRFEGPMNRNFINGYFVLTFSFRILSEV